MELSLERRGHSIPHLHGIQLLLIRVRVILLTLHDCRASLIVSLSDLQIDVKLVDPESLQLGELGLDCLRRTNSLPLGQSSAIDSRLSFDFCSWHVFSASKLLP